MRSRHIRGTAPRLLAVATETASGKVEREIEIVVAERRAGRAGDGLEEGRPHAGGVVVEAVDLVEDEHGVANAERCPASRDR